MDGRDAQGSHGGYEQRTVKRRKPCQPEGQEAEVVPRLQQGYQPPKQQPGNQIQSVCQFVKGGIQGRAFTSWTFSSKRRNTVSAVSAGSKTTLMTVSGELVDISFLMVMLTSMTRSRL